MNANSLLRVASLLAMMPTLGIAQMRQSQDPVVLKHWAAPLYWQPKAAAASATSSADPNPLVLVGIIPCRVVDTRASQAFPPPFGAPSLGGGSRTFPFPSSTTCSIPKAAQGYSLNVTVVPSTPAGFITAYPTGQALPLAATLVWAQGSLTSNAAILPAGTNGSIDVYASSTTDLVIDINGYYVPPGSVPTGTVNTALGISALSSNTTSGDGNTAVGAFALGANTTGQENTAFGWNALRSNTTGESNTAVGSYALVASTGDSNVAIGREALANITTGSGNIAIGSLAGIDLSGGAFSDIHIGNAGSPSDNNTIRIGQGQASFFAAGIRGVTTGNNDAIPVVIDSNGQLGTVSSSRRFKEEIQDMGDASRALLRLRPVTFRYQKPFDDGSKPIQYGLVAEEVAEVFPDLVARSADGQIETVKYQVLDSLLLNEVQRQQAEIASLQGQIQELQEQSSKRGKRRFHASK
jgi:hypothetical protein